MSKTELIARILAADHTQSLLTPTTVTAATPNDGQDGGREQDGGKTQGEVKERKGGNPRPISSKGDTLPTTAPTSTPTPKLTPAGDVIDAIAQVESTSAIISQNEQQGQNQTSHSQPSATKAKDGKEKKGGGTGRKRKSPGGEEGSLSATTTGVNDETPRVPVPKLAKKVTKPVPKPPQPTQRVPSSAPPPTGNSSTSSATPPPTGTTTGTFGARTSVSQVSSITGDLDMVTSVIKPSKPNPIVLPKSTPKAGITKLKSKSTQPRPEFKPLTIVRPTQTPAPLPPTIPETKIPLDSPTDRLTYLEGHFLNTVSIHLHSNRIKPILAPPYPTPTPYPTSSITSHLAFQGLDPSLYTSHTPEEFEVGLRFWIARLHTSLQLGSGDAWSAKAGGMGVMGPDMADWPPIIDCHRIVGDIWKIKTLGNGEEVAFIVVGCIGEVTGHSRVRTVDPKDPNEEELGLVEVEVEGCRVRSDWAGYINNGAKTDVGSLVKSKDSYNFPGGISKTWLARAGVGRSAIDVRIAERSVLASCALNSLVKPTNAETGIAAAILDH